MGGQWHFEPDSYLDLVRSEIADYDLLQDRLATATGGVPADRILDLGSGTGVTAQRIAQLHPSATLVGIDASDDMLAHARRLVPTGTFLVGALEDPLPEGRFDLVVSAFAIHHLDHEAKADLYRRVADRLTPGGLFVWCDIIEPTGPVDRPVPIEPGVDRPAPLADHLLWLRAARLETEVVHHAADIAIVGSRSTA